MTPGLERDIVDHGAYERNLAQLRDLGVSLPRIADLADPFNRLAAKAVEIADADPDAPDPRNLFRVHWHNGPDRRGLVEVPGHVVLPEALTGVKARIVVALGNRFPMINAHKVLAAYGCLIPRLMSGALDMSRHRAVWALDRELLPRRRGGGEAARLPFGRCAAGRHEPGTVQLAGKNGWSTRPTFIARRGPRAMSRKSTMPATCWPGIRRT